MPIYTAEEPLSYDLMCEMLSKWGVVPDKFDIAKVGEEIHIKPWGELVCDIITLTQQEFLEQPFKRVWVGRKIGTTQYPGQKKISQSHLMTPDGHGWIRQNKALVEGLARGIVIQDN